MGTANPALLVRCGVVWTYIPRYRNPRLQILKFKSDTVASDFR